MKTSLFLLGLGVFALGCGSPQKPVTFLTSAKAETAIDVVNRTLAAEGHTPAGGDRQANIVQTEWKDTGFLYGQVQNTPASIVGRRHGSPRHVRRARGDPRQVPRGARRARTQAAGRARRASRGEGFAREVVR
jgi:hypothetical protein